MADNLAPLGEEEQGTDRVDALFAGAGTPGALARPWRTRQIVGLLLVAVPLNLAGLLCCTVVPGTLLTLRAWSLARQELAVLEHGELPVRETLRLTRLERFAGWMLAACAVLLCAQVYLLVTGFYRGLLLRLDLWLAA